MISLDIKRSTICETSIKNGKTQQQQQQQGTNNHCGPVLLLCFYPILQTKTVAPCVVLPPPLLKQPICNPFSLFLLISTNKDCGPVCCSDPPPSNNPSTNKDCGPLCCSDPPPLQQHFYKNNSQDDVEENQPHTR